MDFVADYAGMNAGEIGAWFLIITVAGFLARMIVLGRKILGLWGDAAIGLIGVFVAGTIMRLLDFNLAAFISQNVNALTSSAIWIDIALSAFLGALVIRAILRPFTGRG